MGECDKEEKNSYKQKIYFYIIKTIVCTISGIVLAAASELIEKLPDYFQKDDPYNRPENFFHAVIEQTEEKDYDAYYKVYNDTQVSVASIGLQYLFHVKYNDLPIITIRLDNVYSQPAYLYDGESRVFWLKRKLSSGYEPLRDAIKSKVCEKLITENISEDKLEIEAMTFCCVDANNSDDIYLLLGDNTAITEVPEDKLIYYTNGIDYDYIQMENVEYSHIQDIVEDIVSRIQQIE